MSRLPRNLSTKFRPLFQWPPGWSWTRSPAHNLLLKLIGQVSSLSFICQTFTSPKLVMTHLFVPSSPHCEIVSCGKTFWRVMGAGAERFPRSRWAPGSGLPDVPLIPRGHSPASLGHPPCVYTSGLTHSVWPPSHGCVHRFRTGSMSTRPAREPRICWPDTGRTGVRQL